MQIEEFNVKYQLVASAINNVDKAEDIPNLILELAFNGFVLIETNLEDDMPMICKLLALPKLIVRKTSDGTVLEHEAKRWYYLLPADDYKP